MVDISSVQVVDNHCHSLLRAPVRGRDAIRLLFAEANGPAFAAFIGSMAYYRAAIAALARELVVEPDEETVLAARAAQPHEVWISRLLGAAGLDTLLVNDGFPPPTRLTRARSWPRSPGAKSAACGGWRSPRRR